LCSLNIHERQLVLIGNYIIVCETFYLYGYSKVVPSWSSCMDTHEY
jgi:hypothetical protein